MNTPKIALLPENLRQRTSLRLQNGDEDKKIAQWLSRLPDAKKALLPEFGESAVRENDVAEWRHSGHRTWLARQVVAGEVRRLCGEAVDLGRAADGGLMDNMATWVAGRYVMASRQLAGENGDGVLDWEMLRAFSHDLVHLRRGDHSAEWLRIQRERLEMQRTEQKENLEKMYRKWAKENPEKLPQPPKLTHAEKDERIRRIFGLM
jgi:hypothetical protein